MYSSVQKRTEYAIKCPRETTGSPKHRKLKKTELLKVRFFSAYLCTGITMPDWFLDVVGPILERHSIAAPFKTRLVFTIRILGRYCICKLCIRLLVFPTKC